MRADLLAPMPGIRILTVLRDKDGVVVRAAGSGSRRCPDCGTLSASCKGNYILDAQFWSRLCVMARNKKRPNRADRRAGKPPTGRIPMEPMPVPAGLRRKIFLFAFKWRIRSRVLFRGIKEKDSVKPGFIFTLYVAGVGVGMAAYSTSIPSEFFYLAYLLVAVATLLLVIKIWSITKSQTLLIGGQTTALVIGVLLCVELMRIEVGRELLLLNGSLIPANDTMDKADFCGLSQKDLLVTILSNDLTVVSATSRLNIVSSDLVLADGGHDLLFLERGRNGTVTVNLHARDTEGKAILDIDENVFEINRNKILDSLSPPRPDKSTILIRDEQGSDLKIRLMNRNAISFRGRIYFGKRYVSFRDKGIFTGPPDSPFLDGACLIQNSTGAIIHLTGAK
jgi:hypothetical protein